MTLFDTHCHLDFEAFDGDRGTLVARARGEGVEAIHVPGIKPTQWARAAALRAGQPGAGVGIGVGIHPWWLERLTPAELEAGLAQLQAEALRLGAEAIGECGLDTPLAKRGGPSLDEQAQVLAQHLQVAHALQLPVVLHVVGAHGRALALLREHGPLAAGGVLHSYSGSVELVREYAALGLSFSFAGIVTRDNARRPIAAAAAVPADRLLLESDGPDQPLSGQTRSTPADLPAIAEAVATARGVSPETIARITTANARRLFRRAAGPSMQPDDANAT